jgi:hypothetical protein
MDHEIRLEQEAR